MSALVHSLDGPLGMVQPGVPLAPPEAPIPSFDATPGSLTGWLEVENTNVSNESIELSMEAVQQRYADLPEPDEDPVGHQTRMRVLIREALGSDEFSGFLTVLSPDGAPATVTVVSCLARYNAGLGAVSNLSGSVFGFLGETLEDQLPPLVQIPGNADEFARVLTPLQVCAPTAAQLNTHYAVPNASRLMPLMPEAPEAILTPLALLPTAWATYFLDSKSPMDAFRMMERLVATLDTEEQKLRAESLVQWCAAACVRSGPGANQRRLSQLNVEWGSPAAPDRRLSLWAKRLISPFRIAPTPAPGANPAPVPPLNANPGGLRWNVEPTAGNYSEMEHSKIRSMCSLDEAAYETDRPPIYTALLTEGRTLSKVDAVLTNFLEPDPESELPIHIFVTPEMVKDVKDLRFGYNRDYSYETCHRGISPFAVVAITQANASSRRRAQDRAARATHLTPSDVAAMESAPSQCPRSYSGLVQLLHAYLHFLLVLCGSQCHHRMEVLEVRRVLLNRISVYQSMRPQEVAQVLWSIFTDARDFFSDKSLDVLPRSNLRFLRSWLITSSLKETMNCPVDKLLGLSTTRERAGTVGTAGASADIFESAGERGSGGSRVNRFYHADLQEATRDLLRAHPSVKMVEVMRAADDPMRYSDVKMGANGSCLDVHYFGECKNDECTYKHGSVGKAGENSVRRILPKLKLAVDAYMRNNG